MPPPIENQQSRLALLETSVRRRRSLQVESCRKREKSNFHSSVEDTHDLRWSDRFRALLLCCRRPSPSTTLSWRLAENERNQTFTALLKLDPQTRNLQCGDALILNVEPVMYLMILQVLSDAGLAQDVVNKVNKLSEETLRLEPLERMITAQILQKNAVMQMVDNKRRSSERLVVLQRLLGCVRRCEQVVRSGVAVVDRSSERVVPEWWRTVE
ncbi:hypothetical protein E3N88_31991 [Mikania micrantha]|uniref:Uncharacterized protein n=1 Tax=Mikania micrantha TaxID=192012 RepID=A0A5N6M7J6_9ASTR|nr:hypothetical protein E3N88_31991 [Mikania micrantha]